MSCERFIMSSNRIKIEIEPKDVLKFGCFETAWTPRVYKCPYYVTSVDWLQAQH